MATCEHRCERHGAFDVRRAIGTAPDVGRLSGVRERGGAGLSALMVSFAPRALDHEEKTRHEPDVVAPLPPAPAHRRTPVLPLTPTLRRIPRP